MVSAIEVFRQRLARKERLVGASVTFSDPLVSEALADSVDFLWIDLEHSSMSPESVNGHLLAARGKRIPALVRVTHSSLPFLKSVLDAGADGIIVPQVESAAEVQQVVDHSRYFPHGRRGFGPRVPTNYGRVDGRSYMEQANRTIFVAIQIETLGAVHAIDEILAISGVDSLVIGPWDLSIALGVPGEFEHPRVKAVVDEIIRKTHSAGLSVGAGMGSDPQYASTMLEQGIDWVQVGGDFSYLIKSADDLVKEITSTFPPTPPFTSHERRS